MMGLRLNQNYFVVEEGGEKNKCGNKTKKRLSEMGLGKAWELGVRGSLWM